MKDDFEGGVPKEAREFDAEKAEKIKRLCRRLDFDFTELDHNMPRLEYPHQVSILISRKENLPSERESEKQGPVVNAKVDVPKKYDSSANKKIHFNIPRRTTEETQTDSYDINLTGKIGFRGAEKVESSELTGFSIEQVGLSSFLIDEISVVASESHNFPILPSAVVSKSRPSFEKRSSNKLPPRSCVEKWFFTLGLN